MHKVVLKDIIMTSKREMIKVKYINKCLAVVLMSSLISCGDDKKEDKTSDLNPWRAVQNNSALASFDLVPNSLNFNSEASKSDYAAIAIAHPLGMTRMIFFSKVDYKVWGIICPDDITQYEGQSLNELLKCEFEESYGPVELDTFLSDLPTGIDGFVLGHELRFGSNQPVMNIRDRYYDLWAHLVGLSGGQQSGSSCSSSTCNGHTTHGNTGSNGSNVYTGNISVTTSGANVDLTIRASDSGVRSGNYSYSGANTDDVIYLHHGTKIRLVMTGANNTVWIQRSFRNRVHVSMTGANCDVKYFD